MIVLNIGLLLKLVAVTVNDMSNVTIDQLPFPMDELSAGRVILRFQNYDTGECYEETCTLNSGIINEQHGSALALPVNDGSSETVRVWNCTTGDWSTFDVYALDTWGVL